MIPISSPIHWKEFLHPLRHYGVKADVRTEGEGGHYWLIAGGDVVLFASSQVPAAERTSGTRRLSTCWSP
jgi:hypothetical protein